MSNKRLYPILLIIFTNILGAGVILPILPLYAEGQFQGSVQQITLLSSAYFGAQFLAAPWLGRLSDRYGRRPLLIVSQMGTVAAFILFIFAGPLGEQIEAWGLNLPLTGGMVMLFTARILDGITGGNITIAQAYVSDITSDENRAQGLGLLQAAFGAGFVFGPAFGGLLGNFGTVVPFIGAAIVTTGTLLLTLFTLQESLPPEERSASGEEGRHRALPLRVALRERTLLLMLVIGFLASLAFSALPAIFSLYADHVIFAEAANPSRIQLYIGLMLAFLGMAQVITQLRLVGPLVTKLGERRLLILGQITLMVAFALIASLEGAILVTLLLGLFAFGTGVSEPTMQALVTRFGSRRMRGHLLGLYQSARSLALIGGPILAGVLYEGIAPRAVFVAGAGIMAVALVGGVLLLKREIKPIGVEISN